jgi:1,4-dihydroxy-2-naphthoate octaprenyltransferase
MFRFNQFTRNEYKDAFLHLRLPFSYFLLPVFIFGLSESGSINVFNSLILFLALHFFIYPASNAYNSFMDKDTGSIGALESPPPVTSLSYYISILFDLIGISLMFFIHIKMVFMIMVYILISKVYSWNKTRLKKLPFTGWLVVVLFQGGYTFLLVSMTAENNFSESWFTMLKLNAFLLSTLLIGAYYPLTQIYQHKEDFERGDITISFKLGINGTFIFSGILFLISFIIAFGYFINYYSSLHFIVFMSALLPAVAYYLYWFIITIKNKSKADFKHTMKMTFISSTCLIISFIVLLLFNHSGILQR